MVRHGPRLSRNRKLAGAVIAGVLLLAAFRGHDPHPTPEAGSGSSAGGSTVATANRLAATAGWGGAQTTCLDELWTRESRFEVTAVNPQSGAYGIPQALPATKMAAAGPAWRTDAATQIRWGLGYIRATYGSPCAAWAHEQTDGWY